MVIIKYFHVLSIEDNSCSIADPSVPRRQEVGAAIFCYPKLVAVKTGISHRQVFLNTVM